MGTRGLEKDRIHKHEAPQPKTQAKPQASMKSLVVNEDLAPPVLSAWGTKEDTEGGGGRGVHSRGEDLNCTRCPMPPFHSSAGGENRKGVVLLPPPHTMNCFSAEWGWLLGRVAHGDSLANQSSHGAQTTSPPHELGGQQQRTSLAMGSGGEGQLLECRGGPPLPRDPHIISATAPYHICTPISYLQQPSRKEAL